MRILELLGISSTTKESSEIIKLNGPFIQQDFILKNNHKYIDVMDKSLAKCNLVITRDLLVLSADDNLLTRDDSRVKLGLNHHLHHLELSFNSYVDYKILSIDHFILLNSEDNDIMKKYIDYNLPTEEELNRHLVSNCFKNGLNKCTQA